MKIENLAQIQNQDGGFGRFHSMSYEMPITTEKALRRFLFLNLDKEEPIVKKTLNYVKKCLHKEITIPDRKEKVINWNAFTELMFSSWLTIFQVKDEKVLMIQDIWKNIIEASIIDNKFDINEYKKQYKLVYGNVGVREIDPGSFYMVCLLKNLLNDTAKKAYFNYIMERGIYYIYGKNLYQLPSVLASKATIYYLLAIKLISSYTTSEDDLHFVKKWIEANKSVDGYWQMDNLKPDGIIFPQSDNWRKRENKIKDINEFMNDILFSINNL